MKKHLNSQTPLSIILNVILIINVVVVVYPVLFTISSSLTKSNSLAQSSVIPFTEMTKKAVENDCAACEDGFAVAEDGTKSVCDVCSGNGVVQALDYSFKFKAPSVYQFKRLLTDSDKLIESKSYDVKSTIPDTAYENKFVVNESEKKAFDEFSDNFDAKAVETVLNKNENAASNAEFKPISEENADNLKKEINAKFDAFKNYVNKAVNKNAEPYREYSFSKQTLSVAGTNYKNWYRNTFFVACINTIVTVIVCATTGYIFSRFEFPGRKKIMAGFIILQMFPSFIGMVATYQILNKLDALNTLWGLVLVYAAGSIPFNAQLMKSYFDTMPRDIAEAAYIDGASPLVAYIRVILPAAKPQIVFLTLTSFTGPWMDYIFPRLVLTSDDKKTLAVGLFEMINGRANDNFTMFAAGAILVAVPFAIFFMLGQRSLLQSLAGTSGKE